MSLRDTLRKSFLDFCASIRDDVPRLPSFFSIYPTIFDKIQSHRISAEDAVAAHSFVSIVSSITSDIMQLHNSTHHLIEQSMADVVRLLENQMSNLTINEGRQSSKTDVSRHPAYIKQSYQWLLENLHNPYPSKEIKKEISRQTSSSLKDIDAWFIDVRKRIGWNRIRKVHFSNKQEKIVAAACNVFRPKTSSYSDSLESSLISEMNPNEAYRAEFLTMARNARSLYKVPELTLALSDHHVLPTEPLVEPPHTFEDLKSNLTALSPSVNDVSSYPTPRASPPSYSTALSPTPSPPSDPETSVPSSRQKRHRSSVETDESEIGTRRPTKRHRTDILRSEDSILDPSPSPSVRNSPEETSNDVFPDTVLDTISSPPTISSINVSKRKRRLSDGDCQLPSKRPHNALCLPRLQTVSDPFPTSKPLFESNSNGWCHPSPISDLSDDIPLPANVEQSLSLTLPLDIDFHQYTSPLPEHPDSVSLENMGSDAFSIIGDVLKDTASFGKSDVQFDLISGPYNLDFQCNDLNAADHFSTFEDADLLPFVPGHIPHPSTLQLGDDCPSLDGLGWASLSCLEDPALQDSNYTLPKRFSTPDEQEAKRARAQALREELAQLVAEGL